VQQDDVVWQLQRTTRSRCASSPSCALASS
jgi:hypothetical protein